MLKNKKSGGDNMQLTVMFKINPTLEQELILDKIMREYVKTINSTVDLILAGNNKLTSKWINAQLPSTVKSQVIRDSKSIVSKFKKACKKDDKAKKPIAKKSVCIWNNQNYKICEGAIRFPVLINNKCTRIEVNASLTEYQIKLLENKLGTLRITKKSNKYMAQVSVSVEEATNHNTQVMGVDLGLKVPAVCVTENGKTKFFGNGRENKYIKRKYRALRKELGKAKKINKIKSINNKEQRQMKDKDHKVSRQIINFAKDNNVSEIHLESLTNIRSAARTSRKNEKNLHTWSFYRLALYIEYKANLEGIKVSYVKPEYTSQICPCCGNKNKARDRKYVCSCGFTSHRDRVGAINIIKAPVIVGNRQSA